MGDRERTTELKDGRLLGWAEWGDPKGSPVLYRLLLGVALAGSRRRPAQAARSFRSDLSDADRRVFDALSDEAKSMGWFLESGRQGARGPVHEYRLLGDWGFALEEVTAPVSVWQGDVDKLVPTEHAEDIVARAPGATMVRCPGEGHLAMMTHAEQLLATAAGMQSLSATR